VVTDFCGLALHLGVMVLIFADIWCCTVLPQCLKDQGWEPAAIDSVVQTLVVLTMFIAVFAPFILYWNLWRRDIRSALIVLPAGIPLLVSSMVGLCKESPSMPNLHVEWVHVFIGVSLCWIIQSVLIGCVCNFGLNKMWLWLREFLFGAAALDALEVLRWNFQTMRMELEPGMQVCRSGAFGFVALTHHGLYVGKEDGDVDDMVVHTDGSPGQVEIKKIKLQDFKQGGNTNSLSSASNLASYGWGRGRGNLFFTKDYGRMQNLPDQAAARRALDVVGKKFEYDVIHRNCEAFAAWCIFGEESYDEFMQGKHGSETLKNSFTGQGFCLTWATTLLLGLTLFGVYRFSAMLSWNVRGPLLLSMSGPLIWSMYKCCSTACAAADRKQGRLICIEQDTWVFIDLPEEATCRMM